jgi:hypothetical protein
MKSHDTTSDNDSKSRAAANDRQRNIGAEKTELVSPGVIAQCKHLEMIDNSPSLTAQRKRLRGLSGQALQKQEDLEDEELMQGKFTAQKQRSENRTGMPDDLKANMESSFNTDFSNVRVYPNSGKAIEVGALAYTQGTDIHFAPGQFKPEASAGQQLLGHELTHVVQQRQGRVQPTGEVAGLPVNDSPDLEKEADRLGEKVVK